ncbi:hypothetical protein [Brevundimonas naejangsanensis]
MIKTDHTAASAALKTAAAQTAPDTAVRQHWISVARVLSITCARALRRTS